MFRGEVEYNVDEKCRVLIPARWREELGETVALVRGVLGQIHMYPKTHLDKKLAQLEEAGGADKAPFTLLLLRAANECDLDKQGRIVLPPVLRRHARIDGEVVMVGDGERVEIWNPDRWNDAYDEYVKQLGVPADHFGVLADVGLRP